MSENQNMNQFKAQVTCGNCQTKGVYQVITLIDTMKDPRALEKVLNASWFAYTCPSCGSVQTILYSCMFHDASKNILYAYGDTEEDYQHMIGLLSGEESDGGVIDALQEWLKVCECRVCNSYSSFQEKLLISYLGLDDKVIEICKATVGNILLSNQKVKNIENMYFNTADDGWIFMIDTGEDELLECTLEKEMYENVRDTIVTKLNVDDDNSVVIDGAWVNRVMQRLN